MLRLRDLFVWFLNSSENCIRIIQPQLWQGGYLTCGYMVSRIVLLIRLFVVPWLSPSLTQDYQCYMIIPSLTQDYPGLKSRAGLGYITSSCLSLLTIPSIPLILPHCPPDTQILPNTQPSKVPTLQILYKHTRQFSAPHSYKAKNRPSYRRPVDQKVEQRKTHYILGEPLSFFNYFSITISTFNNVKYDFLHSVAAYSLKYFKVFGVSLPRVWKFTNLLKLIWQIGVVDSSPMKLLKNEDSFLSISFIIGSLTLGWGARAPHPLAYSGDIFRHFQTFWHPRT